MCCCLPEIPGLAMCISKALGLWDEYEVSGKLVYLDRAILNQCRTVYLFPEDHHNKPAMFINLGYFLKTRYGRLAELDDLESTISAYQQGVELANNGHPDRAELLHCLGDALSTHFRRLEGLNDLEQAISLLRCAIELTLEEDPKMPKRLHSLGLSLSARFKHLGELKDLEDAISLQRRAIELTPDGHTDMPAHINNLGSFYGERFGRLKELDNLESAILLLQRALLLTPEGHIDMPGRLSNLGSYLSARFARLGMIEDLESAISMRRRAVELKPKGDSRLAMCLSNLGDSLKFRFERFGELDDLESAISMLRRSVELGPESYSHMSKRLPNLALTLSMRFDRLGELEDLESAIAAQRRAVSLAPKDHPSIPKLLNGLAGMLCSRFERLGELSDLENAISTQNSAINSTPEGHPDLSAWLDTLGSLLFRRFERLGELGDLEHAICNAIMLTPEGDRSMPIKLNNLTGPLVTRFKRLEELDDLDSAILMQRHAVELTPEGHPNMLTLLTSLGHALQRRFQIHKTQETFDTAVDVLKTASTQTKSLSSKRLWPAATWAQMETENPEFGSSESRLQAFSRIFDTLPEIVWLGYSINRRYQESADVAIHISNGVSAAIELSDLRQAVEWSDVGRGLTWSQILSLRTPVDDLAQHHPDLAEEFQRLSSELQTAHLVQLPKATRSADFFLTNEANQHRGLVINYENCLKKIRACPWFGCFLRPQKLTNLTSLTEQLDGTFVYINVSSSRCDAVAISRGGVVQLVPLPNLTQGLAKQLRSDYNSYLHSSKLGQRALVLQSEAQADKLVAILDLLWSSTVHPILKALNFMSTSHASLPHITWCPTRALTQLPFHAAGFHPEPGQAGLHVYDFVVSSYAPSLSALVRAQKSLAREPASPSVLIVTQPATPNQSPLPGTVGEGAYLQRILSESHIKSEAFNGEQATVETVQSAIGRLPWVHFACHGVQDPNNPTQSAFALHNGDLTLSMLMRTVAEGAELAFLSACQTATGDEKASEESAHLTAGMLAVGFKGVVGTMWSIGDADAPIVVEAYYEKLLELRRTGAIAEGSTGAAYALHEAVKVLRERVGKKSFSRWVPFVHYGV